MPDTLQNIASEIVVCRLCKLSEGRKNAVPGEGDEHARLMIIGEAPGKYEDLQGRPFVGMSGKFLNKCLETVGISRQDAFVTNAVKCRPPSNRKPLEQEIAACRPYLISQIAAIKPKLLLTLGTSACNALGIKYTHLSDVRGKIIDMALGATKVRCFVTFHPSFPMRFPSKREAFLKDLSNVKNLITTLQ